MDNLAVILAIGALTGLASAMFGIGGSVLASPLLQLFVISNPIVALATPLPVAIPSAITGSLTYRREGLINYRLAWLSLSAAIPFGWLGGHLSGIIGGDMLIIVKGSFLAALGIKFFLAEWLFRRRSFSPRIKIWSGLMAGAMAGILSGLLAVGGGIVLVAAFVRINNLKMRQAVATSLYCIAVLALINSTKHYIMGHIDISISLVLMLSAIPFAWVGSRLTLIINGRLLEKLFGIAMIIFALLFIISRIEI